MKSAELKTKCACGEDLKFTINKPSFIQEAVAKVVCVGCDSHFMFMAKLKPNSKGRDISFRNKGLFISDKLRQIILASKAKSKGV